MFRNVYSAQTSFFALAERFGLRDHSAPKPLRRVLSLARVHGVRTIVEISLPLDGDSKSELAALAQAGKPASRIRTLLAFSKSSVRRVEVSEIIPECVGYCIVHKDTYVDQPKNDVAYVAEAVMQPPRDEHVDQYLLSQRRFTRRFLGTRLAVRGVYFAQQPQMTGCCAHAAIRSVLNTAGKADIGYCEINELLELPIPRERAADLGLTNHQVRRVLMSRQLSVTPFAYEVGDRGQVRELDDHERRLGTFQHVMDMLPIKEMLYHAIESGFPALLAWEPTPDRTRGETENGHVMSVVGHWFSPDTWIVEAENEYFALTREGEPPVEYLRSSGWTRDFVICDDNFGPYYSMAADALQRHRGIVRILVVTPRGCRFIPHLVQRRAIADLQEVGIPALQERSDFPNTEWAARLQQALEGRKAIIRTTWAERRSYLDQLERSPDIETVHGLSLDLLGKHLPEKFWLAEVSIPELYTANKSKLADLYYVQGRSGEPHMTAYRLPAFFSFEVSRDVYHHKRTLLDSHYRLYVTSNRPL